MRGPLARLLVGLLLVGAVTAASTGCAGPGTNGSGPPVEQWPVPTEPAVLRPSWTSCAVEAFPPDGAPQGGGTQGGGTQDGAPQDGAPQDGGTRDGVPPQDDEDPLALPRLPDSFVATSAVLCVRAPQQRPDGGQDLVEFERRAEDVGALVTALRLPDEPRTDNPCLLNLVLVPWFALLDAEGRWNRPGVPRNACGQPRREVVRALDQLTLTQVSARPVREIESAGAAASGCGQSRADTIAMHTHLAPAQTPGRLDGVPLGAARQIRLCVYRVPADQQGSTKPAGNFEYGLPLPADRWTALRAALADREPARECALPASRFALLQEAGAPGGAEVTVELDGCRRILLTAGSGGSTLTQGDAALADLLGPE